MSKPLDLITIGRSSVDLYGAQIGGRLEDMRSFDKYIGGSPTNIACGTARLGLRSAVITGVGDEHMGRFIREELEREGVDTRGVKTDPGRLTALVLLGIRDQERFPLIFYRENCADMGLTEDDIDAAFIREARAVVATGTHLSHPQVEAATLKALRLAREERPADGARHRLPPEPLGGCGAWRGREPVRRKCGRHGQAAIDAAPVRPDRGHRGGVSHRRGDDGHGGGPARGPQGLGRDAGLQARRDGRGRLHWRRARQPGRGRGGSGLPDRGLQRARGRGRVHVRAAQGLARRRGLADGSQVCQRLRGLRGQPSRLYPGLSVLGRASVLLRTRDQAQGCAQRHRTGTGALGDEPASRLAGGAGLRLRPPHAARGAWTARRRKRSAGSRIFASTRRSTWQVAVPVTACCATGGWGGTRFTGPPERVSGSGDRWSGPARAR